MKQKKMPKWEKEAREKMEKELEDGCFYSISTGKMFIQGGKGFYIDFNIALIREARKYTKYIGENDNTKDNKTL